MTSVKSIIDCTSLFWLRSSGSAGGLINVSIDDDGSKSHISSHE